MLHVLNGDAVLEPFRQARLPGRAVVWGDIALEGPLRNGLASEADWAFRAAELERRRGMPAQAYLARMHACRAALAAAEHQDEVVLWFEQDLHCQLNFAYVLRVLAEQGPARVALVAPDEPLGAKRAPADLEAMLERRSVAGRELLDLATRAWRAFGDADPRALEALRRADLGAWPALGTGILRQLERFPALGDGLAAVERAALRALEPGPRPFRELFRAIGEAPGLQGVGLGDASFARVLLDLARGPRPLVAPEPAPAEGRFPEAEAFLDWRVAATPRGRDVLAGRADALEGRPLDRWVGGTHLGPGKPIWRWDARSQRLAY